MRAARRLGLCACGVAPALLACTLAVLPAAADPPQMAVRETSGGVRFGLWGTGAKPQRPAPLLFVFATGFHETLSQPQYSQVGRSLAERGCLCASLDLPCHGADQPPGEPPGLDGWRHRLEHGDDFVGQFTARASAVLDFLIEQGYGDPQRVAACGTSRGGFMALSFAAAEPRVRAVAAFAPVTDLRALREFQGLEEHPAAAALKLGGQAERLAGRSVWLCIGNHDERVDTDEAIAFTRLLVRAAVAAAKKPDVELHVMPSEGHRIHDTAHQEAAAWLAPRLLPDDAGKP